MGKQVDDLFAEVLRLMVHQRTGGGAPMALSEQERERIRQAALQQAIAQKTAAQLALIQAPRAA